MTSDVPRILWAVEDEPCNTLLNSGEFTTDKASSFNDAFADLDEALRSNKPFAIFWLEWLRGLDYKYLEKIAAHAPRLHFVIEGEDDILPPSSARSKLISPDRIIFLEKPVIPSTRRSIARHLAARLDDRDILTGKGTRQTGDGEISNMSQRDILYSTVERLHAAPSLPAGLATTLTEISNFMGARTASLAVLEGSDTLRVVEAVGPGSEHLVGKSMPLSKSHIAKHALAKKEPVIITDNVKNKHTDDGSDGQTYVPESVLSVPIFTGSHPLAVLNFGGDDGVAIFTQHNSELVATLARQFAVALEKDTLMNHLRTAMSGSIRALVGAIEAKDTYTRGHSDRVTHYSVLTAIELGLPLSEVEVIKQAAILHDVGKIGIPGEVLNKETKLSDDELNIVQQHPNIGISIVQQIGAMNATLPIIRAHHEKLDGTGYPNNLKGDEIPFGARILAVADAYDAMISNRPYRKTVTPNAALAELRRCAGTQFDPKVVETFCSNINHWPTEKTAHDLLTSFL